MKKDNLIKYEGYNYKVLEINDVNEKIVMLEHLSVNDCPVCGNVLEPKIRFVPLSKLLKDSKSLNPITKYIDMLGDKYAEKCNVRGCNDKGYYEVKGGTVQCDQCYGNMKSKYRFIKEIENLLEDKKSIV